MLYAYSTPLYFVIITCGFDKDIKNYVSGFVSTLLLLIALINGSTHIEMNFKQF